MSLHSLEQHMWPEQVCAILHLRHMWGFVLRLKAHLRARGDSGPLILQGSERELTRS